MIIKRKLYSTHKIEFRQKEFAAAAGKKIVSATMRVCDKVGSIAQKALKKGGSKTVAKSIVKDDLNSKLKKIQERYKDNPSILKRKMKKAIRIHNNTKEERISKLQDTAFKKLDNLRPDILRPKEVVDAKAEEIVKNLPKNAVKTVVKLPKNVYKGAKYVYEDTGKIIAKGGEALNRHPIAAPGWASGDVFNATMIATGNPELTAVPVGSIVGGVGYAGETIMFPRKVRRKFRQNGIRFRKKHTNGKGLDNFSIKKVFNTNSIPANAVGHKI